MPYRGEHKPTYDTIHCTITDHHPSSQAFFDVGTLFYIKQIEFFKSTADAVLSENGTVIDLSSKKAAERTLFLDTDTPEGLFGVSEFDSKENALSLKRSDSDGAMADYGSRVKFSLRMKSPSILPPDHHYMVITYKTNIKVTPPRISLFAENFRGNRIILEPDVSASNGEYVRTKPINIHVFEQPGLDFFSRLCRKRHHDSQFTHGILLYVAPSDESGAHAHHQIELLYNKGETVTVYVHDQKCIMECGDVVIVPSMCAHHVAESPASATLYSIKFQSEYLYAYGVPHHTMYSFINSWQEQIRQRPLITAEELRECELDKPIEELIILLRSSSLGHYIKIHAKLLSIFSIMLERDDVEKKEGALPNALTASFERVIEEAQKRICNFTASDAAKICNLSYNYFCSSFKKAYGMSFQSYLLSLRLNESTRLLLTTDMSITDIAMLAGFTDASYFIMKFKQAYKITPHQFRNSMQNKG